MKKWTDRVSGRAAAIALGMVMAACIPAGAAWGSCEVLGTHLLLAWQKGTENPTKPQDVSVSSSLIGSGWNIGWNLPSNRPASTYTGYRVHFTHSSSGTTKEYSRSTSTGATSHYISGCITDSKCTGAFDVKVILQNNCGLSEEYSDAVTYTFG